ncbi:unnamed protein product [Leuciscus chuanchicus]
MLDRVLEQSKALTQVLSDDRKTRHLVPTWQDIEVLESINSALKPLQELTDILSGEEYVSVSYLKPVLYLLKNTTLAAKEEDTDLMKTIKSKIIAYLEKNYNDPETQELLDVASLLDPRFKKDYISPENVTRIEDRVRVEIEEIARTEKRPHVSDTGATEKKGLRSVGSLFTKHTPSAAVQVEAVIDAELNSYLMAPVITGEKHIFSASDNIVTCERACLKPEMLDETTTVAGESVLIVYVQYVDGDELKRDILMSTNLPTTTTGQDIFMAVDSYLTSYNLPYTNIVACCTDGAAAMMGRNKGFNSRLMEKAPDCLTDGFWIKTAYLADIFTLYNETNKRLQGSESNILECKEAIDAFMRKLEYRAGKMSQGHLQHFPLLLQHSGGTVSASLRAEFCRHMTALQEELKSRFADVDALSKESWVMDPFTSRLEDVEYLGCEDELTELQTDSLSKKYFQENGFKRLWIARGPVVAPKPANYAITKIILPFSTTYLSETAFSALVAIKTKSRNRLEVHSDFRLAVTGITPDIPSLVKGMQAQVPLCRRRLRRAPTSTLEASTLAQPKAEHKVKQCFHPAKHFLFPWCQGLLSELVLDPKDP